MATVEEAVRKHKKYGLSFDTLTAVVM